MTPPRASGFRIRWSIHDQGRRGRCQRCANARTSQWSFRRGGHPRKGVNGAPAARGSGVSAGVRGSSRPHVGRRIVGAPLRRPSRNPPSNETIAESTHQACLMDWSADSLWRFRSAWPGGRTGISWGPWRRGQPPSASARTTSVSLPDTTAATDFRGACCRWTLADGGSPQTRVGTYWRSASGRGSISPSTVRTSD